MDRASDTQAGAKHRCTAAAMRHFRTEVMELCQGAGLYQIDLLGGSKNRVTEREYWAQKKGQLALDTEAAAQGKPPTKFETDKEKLRREIRAVLNLAVSFEDFAQRLLQRGITVKESRGRLSYLTPDRAKPITARKLGDDFDRAAVGAALERNAARPSLGAKPSIREQLRQPQGVQRMVDIEAKKAEGKGIGYQQWASVFNLKQIANSVNVYTEYGFSSPEELDAAVSAAFAAVRDSAASLKPKELALKEKKELRRQIIIYRNTKAVRDGLAAQKTPKARAAYRQEHEGDLLLSEATIRFFKANGITKLPTVKELTAEIEALMSEKNAGYNEYQERKREAEKAAVHPPLQGPPLDLVIVAHPQFEVHPGVVLLKSPDDPGQPVGGHAGKGTDTDETGLEPLQLIHLGLELFILPAEALGIGQELDPLGGEFHPRPASVQKGDLPLLLQVLDHPAHP